MLVGHAHMSSYQVVGRNQTIYYPEQGFFEDVIVRCESETYDYVKGTWDVKVKRGDLHEIMIGSSGTYLDPICPIYKTEFDLKFKNNEIHSFLIGEVSVDSMKFTFWTWEMDDIFKLEIL